jgi:hypothetical protein
MCHREIVDEGGVIDEGGEGLYQRCLHRKTADHAVSILRCGTPLLTGILSRIGDWRGWAPHSPHESECLNPKSGTNHFVVVQESSHLTGWLQHSS